MDARRQDLIEGLINPLTARLLNEIATAPLPSRLFHYSHPEGISAVLASRVLWLTEQPNKGDRPNDSRELHWGNDLLRDTALAASESTGFSPLSRMVTDASASLFGVDQTMFVACFTEDDQQCRYPHGAMLIFDAPKISIHGPLTLETRRMGKVRYDEDGLRRAARVFFEGLAAVGRIAGPLDDEEERLFAQCAMDAGLLSYFAKRSKFEWEKEWRLVKNLGYAKPHGMPLRLELSLANPECGLIGIQLGPIASASFRASVESLAERWPYPLPVLIGP